ncbi:MAG: class I tRNA ligase family protein [Planctomycetes bacterium]|nr:class I tRNA ligase family protein [Planctomycetota bacterium]
MSKSRGNGVDPFELMEKYGADVVRWYLLTSTSVWLPTKFDEEGLVAIKRKFFDTLLNTYRFFVMYANVDGFDLKSERISLEERTDMDRWLLASMNTVVKGYLADMDSYDITKAFNRLADFFVEDVSNWYVRLNRRRFWKEGDTKDKMAAYCTLQEVIIATCHLMAPAAPFLSDHIFQQLTGEDSVHLSLMPEPDENLANDKLESKMQLTRQIVELGRTLRTRHNLKVRQPLESILVQSHEEVFADLILAELNVKNYQPIGADEEIVKKKAKVNFRKLGPVFGKKVPLVAKELGKMNQEQISIIEKGESLTILLEGEEAKVPAECVDIICDQLEGLVAEGDGAIMVALKTELNDELLQEGFSREFVNRLQNCRKEMDLEITDRIHVKVHSDEKTLATLEKFADSINYELLSTMETCTAMPEGALAYKIDTTEMSVLVTKKT